MREVGGGAGLVLELPVEVGAVGLVFAQDLDGDVAAQQGIAAAVDEGHAAGAETLEELVALVEQAAFVGGHREDYNGDGEGSCQAGSGQR